MLEIHSLAALLADKNFKLKTAKDIFIFLVAVGEETNTQLQRYDARTFLRSNEGVMPAFIHTQLVPQFVELLLEEFDVDFHEGPTVFYAKLKQIEKALIGAEIFMTDYKRLEHLYTLLYLQKASMQSQLSEH